MRDDLGTLDPPSAVTGKHTLVRLAGISVRAGETALLDDISLAISVGAPTVVIGPNGSGKTTLLRVIMGLAAPAAGQMTVAAARRAIMFQKPVMLRRTAAANIAFALDAAGRSADRAAIDDLLRQVGLSDFADRPARKLSGGEQQRLALARALACKPDLLLLDEPTASLDPAQTKAVEDIVARVAANGVKVVMATHDLGEARRLAGEIVLLVTGRIAEQGPAAQFFHHPRSEAARRFLAGELVI